MDKTITILSTVILLLGVSSCGNPRTDGMTLGEERSTSNEAQITEKMIDAIKQISLARHPEGPIKRFNQSKSLGCFDAAFRVSDDLPDNLAQGLFARPGTYPAKLRFANATKFDDAEKDFRGLSLSVFNVQGETLWGKSGQQDFLLNSHPALFARDGSDFLEFIEATRDDKTWQYFIRPSHFYSLKTALKGRAKIGSPFAIRYWSTTPFRHGPDQKTAVKYSTQPCTSNYKSPAKANSEDFFKGAMAEHLENEAVCLNFMLQFQTDPQSMPIEDASVIWNEKDSPFQTVATIEIQNQDFASPNNQQACEDMSFNPWQSLAAHQPLGDINRLRKAIYSEIAKFRAEHNNQ